MQFNFVYFLDKQESYCCSLRQVFAKLKSRKLKPGVLSFDRHDFVSLQNNESQSNQSLCNPFYFYHLRNAAAGGHKSFIFNNKALIGTQTRCIINCERLLLYWNFHRDFLASTNLTSCKWKNRVNPKFIICFSSLNRQYGFDKEWISARALLSLFSIPRVNIWRQILWLTIAPVFRKNTANFISLILTYFSTSICISSTQNAKVKNAELSYN